MLNLLADNINLQPGANSQCGVLGSLTAAQKIGALIRGAMVVAAVVFFFILIIGGIRWIASGGDKAATEGARSQITAALIGLVIVFAAWAIVALISTFFGGLNILNLTVPSVSGQ